MSDDIEDFSKRLEEARHGKAPSEDEIQKAKDEENKRVGLQAGMEFTASIALGVFLGLTIDGFLGTKPEYFLIFFFLGVCTGFYNIYRVTNNLGNSVGLSRLHKDKKDAKTSQNKENE
ncbi:MAG: AtpZ/AtpI family protein [Pseudomonadota bacterium]